MNWNALYSFQKNVPLKLIKITNKFFFVFPQLYIYVHIVNECIEFYNINCAVVCVCSRKDFCIVLCVNCVY